MPFSLVSGISPTTIKWGVIALVVGLLSLKLWLTSNSLESTKKDLIVAKQNIFTLKASLRAEKNKAIQREVDAKVKQKTIDDLETQKIELTKDFTETKTELNHLLNTVIPNITSQEDLVKANEIGQQAVALSYEQIQAATEGKSNEKVN